MTTAKTKKRLNFSVYAALFLLGGIEYAVILPTLWLYLDNTYNAPEYMLGLTLSAYSVATLFSSPIFGRIADRTRHSKAIMITCSCIQGVGSFLYCIGISQWLVVGSRFVCGIGGAAEAVALAEVARYTSEKELTGIMSKMVAMRQTALLAAPGFNVVLRLVDFQMGPFHIDKYTVPGAFMMVLWLCHVVMIFVLYSEPIDVYFEEQKMAAKVPRIEASVLYDSIDHRPQSSTAENRRGHGKSRTDKTPRNSVTVRNNNPPTQDHLTVDFSNKSYEVMASAEVFICSSELSSQGEVTQDSQDVTFRDRDSWSMYDVDESSPLLKSEFGRTDSNVIQTVANADYIEHQISHMDDIIAREGRLGFFCNEYIRDDVMAIITLLFCASFSQIALETMCTPLALEYMDFGELENSILYAICGVEVVVAFLVVACLSRCVADRNIILFGGFLLLGANVWLLSFLPSAPSHDRVRNLPYVALTVSLDVVSLPFLLVCATSLYSKMTRKETQGLSQGLRRGMVGLGTILGPLWASYIVGHVYLVLGVLIGIQSLSLLMCVMSYKRLVPLEPEPKSQMHTSAIFIHSSVGSRCNSIVASSTSRDLSLLHEGSHSSRRYGSISSADSLHHNPSYSAPRDHHESITE